MNKLETEEVVKEDDGVIDLRDTTETEEKKIDDTKKHNNDMDIVEVKIMEKKHAK